MTSTLVDGLYRCANWRAGIIITLIYGVFLTQVMAPQGAVMTASAGDWGAPDGHFFYTPDELYAAIGAWNDTARSAYISFRLGLDPVWALVYGTWLMVFTGIGLRHATPAESRWRLLILLPLLPVLADLSENLLGIVLVRALPVEHSLLAWLTACVTAGKWLTLALGHLIALAALLAAAYQRVRLM
ncbi:MAG: hypothetical protein HKN56_10490 [Gammaproteobacteria bacterium]|nr:hypothetical protein [Gammaproteobacteria bacterium]